MRVWPSRLDGEESTVVTHVRTASGEGTSSVAVSEKPEQVEARLRERYVLYRLGKRVTALVKGGEL